MSLLRATERLATSPDSTAEISATLTLSFAQRQKSRLRARLDDGRELAMLLSRGQILRSGDLLRTESGERIRILAADEDLACVRSDDTYALARACYHLGNRHVPLQIERGLLRFARDHVLEAMLRTQGLEVRHERGPFEPEGGAYGHHHHG